VFDTEIPRCVLRMTVWVVDGGWLLILGKDAGRCRRYRRKTQRFNLSVVRRFPPLVPKAKRVSFAPLSPIH
jgi:hypothetical protein